MFTTISLLYREIEQLAARRAHNPKVPGSSPGLATRLLFTNENADFYDRFWHAVVVQLVERFLAKEEVASSNLVHRSKHRILWCFGIMIPMILYGTTLRTACLAGSQNTPYPGCVLFYINFE